MNVNIVSTSLFLILLDFDDKRNKKKLREKLFLLSQTTTISHDAIASNTTNHNVIKRSNKIMKSTTIENKISIRPDQTRL